MKLDRIPDCHLTYCTNIHPGESWQQVWNQFREYLPAVKQTISPDHPFGVGARLSALAAAELLEGNSLSILKSWLAASGLYIFTINGFPYGQFHQGRIKEKVYSPDWSEKARLEYTTQLAHILVELLPAGCNGTISTVPVGLRSQFQDTERLTAARNNLLTMAAILIKIHEDTGRLIQLALEPEPGCYLDKIEDIVSFFHDHLLTDEAMERLQSLTPSCPVPTTETLLHHLGICLDTCHASVMYESPRMLAAVLAEEGIGIFKVQLTAALSAVKIDKESLARLQQLADPVYLHQTTVLTGKGEKRYFLDLPEALQQVTPGDGLRVHYHVPVFTDTINSISTSRNDLIDFLEYFRDNPCCHHLEVETYTFEVLRERGGMGAVVDNISKELRWVMEALDQ